MNEKESSFCDIGGELTQPNMFLHDNGGRDAAAAVKMGDAGGLSLQSGTRLRLQHLSAATGLILTYLIEIGVQIYLIWHCWRSLVLLVSTWDWPSFFILSSLLVSGMSIVFVRRGLDFAGRSCARLLCYIMHLSLLGLVWRYLKLAFAYDHADVQEFIALRIFQVYIQSLPLTSIHLAWLITFPEEMFGRAFWMIVAEILSIGVALIISAYIKSDFPPIPKSKVFNQSKSITKTTQVFSDRLRCSRMSDKIMWCKVLSIELNITSRMMLLLIRLFVLGILLAQMKLWTLVILLLHFVIVFSWIGRSEKPGTSNVSDEESGSNCGEIDQPMPLLSTKEFLIYILQCSYILFWDITSTLQGPMRLSTWALPAFLVIFENGALMILYSYEAQPIQLLIVLIATGCLIFGLGFFFFLNFIEIPKLVTNASNCCPEIESKSSRFGGSSDSSFLKKDCIRTTSASSLEEEDLSCWKDKVAQGKAQEEDDSELKIMSNLEKMSSMMNNGSSRRGSWDLNLTRLALEKGKPLIMANNYTNISEVLMSARVKTTNVGNCTSTKETNERSRKNLVEGLILQRGSPPGSANPSPPIMPTWVPDTCCNDSNGSSNSRNTNTLLEPKDEDDMVLDNPHFVFYVPEQRTDRTASVVRKLNVQTMTDELPGRTRGKVSRRKSNSSRLSHATSFNSGNGGSVIRAGTTAQTVIRTSTPVEIKKASRTRVIMNYPKHHHHRAGEPARAGSRCHHQQQQRVPEVIDPLSDPFYEKLMEDSYGILICEGGNTLGKRNSRVPPQNEEVYHSSSKYPPMFHVNQKLKVLCAKCLRNHDPLLTNCLTEDEDFPSRLEPRAFAAPPPHVPSLPVTIAASDTTEYPSETEMTWTAAGDEQLSVSSHLSTATYTTWPRKHPHLTMSMWTTTNPYPKEFTSREYVRTWLLTSEARAKHYYDNGACAGASSNSSILKRIHRSRTIGTGAGGAISRKVNQNHHRPAHTHTHAHRNLGKRQCPIGRGQSPESMEVLSRIPSLLLTPPPKQKQHPVLPLLQNNLREPSLEISPRKQKKLRCSSSSSRKAKSFYKDLEIIV